MERLLAFLALFSLMLVPPSSAFAACPKGLSALLASKASKVNITWDEPQMIGRRNVSWGLITPLGRSFLVSPGRYIVEYQHNKNNLTICSVNIPSPNSKDVNICKPSTIVFASLLAVTTSAAVVFCLLFVRARRFSGTNRPMVSVPLEPHSKPPILRLGNNHEDPHYLTVTTPPTPPPKPRFLQGTALQHEDDSVDNYGYMCFEVDNRNPEVPRLAKADYH